ncbi:MAG: DUF393 domain-containing protein [Phycisphaerales bacterium]
MTLGSSTTPPDRPLLLYDGECAFCRVSVRRASRVAGRDRVEAVNYHEPGALDDLPGVSAEDCQGAMHLIETSGRVSKGAEAIARVLMMRPVLGLLGRLYYIPGVRWLSDRAYGLIARNRHRISKLYGGASCDSGACALPRRDDR